MKDLNWFAQKSELETCLSQPGEDKSWRQLGGWGLALGMVFKECMMRKVNHWFAQKSDITACLWFPGEDKSGRSFGESPFQPGYNTQSYF